MSAAPRQRRSYDPQIRRLVAEGRGDDIIRRERIPRSTISGWRNRPLPTLVSVGPADGSEASLRAEIAKLERRVKVLTAVMIVLLALVRVSKARLNNVRLVDADDQKRLVRAARRAQSALSKRVIPSCPLIRSTPCQWMPARLIRRRKYQGYWLDRVS